MDSSYGNELQSLTRLEAKIRYEQEMQKVLHGRGGQEDGKRSMYKFIFSSTLVSGALGYSAGWIWHKKLQCSPSWSGTFALSTHRNQTGRMMCQLGVLYSFTFCVIHENLLRFSPWLDYSEPQSSWQSVATCGAICGTLLAQMNHSLSHQPRLAPLWIIFGTSIFHATAFAFLFEVNSAWNKRKVHYWLCCQHTMGETPQRLPHHYRKVYEAFLDQYNRLEEKKRRESGMPHPDDFRDQNGMVDYAAYLAAEFRWNWLSWWWLQPADQKGTVREINDERLAKIKFRRPENYMPVLSDMVYGHVQRSWQDQQRFPGGRPAVTGGSTAGPPVKADDTF